MQDTLSPLEPVLTNLTDYILRVPEIFCAVDEVQFNRLEAKYRHLILKYQNNFQTLSKLKLIEEAIPEIILSNEGVASQMRDIEEIKKKLTASKEKYDMMQEQTVGVRVELEQLQKALQLTNQELVDQKRRYMALRARIDVESVEVREQKPKKFMFRQRRPLLRERHSLVTGPERHAQMDLETMFERGIKEIQKKEFRIINRDIDLVLRNIKINNNIQETLYKTSFKIRPKQKRVVGKSSLGEIKREELSVAMSGIFQTTHSSFGATREQQNQNMDSLSSVQLYSRICQDKGRLCVFNLMMRQLLYNPK